MAPNDPRLPLTGACVRIDAFVRFLSERFPVHLLFLEGAGRPMTRDLPPAKDFYPRLRSARQIRFRPRRYYLFSPGILSVAEQIIRREGIELIVADYGVWGLYGALLARQFGLPFIYSSHNVEWRSCLDKTREDLRRLPLSGYYLAAERFAVRRSNVLIAITGADAAYFRRWRGSAPTLVINQGIDDRLFYAEPSLAPSPERRIVFCGNLSIPFNREVLARVERDILPEVVASHPNAMFEFIGGHPPLVSPHPRMRFTGFVDDYPERLRTCSAAIVPIVHGHGFPTKTVEALACGRPTVATPVGVRGFSRHFPNLYVRTIEQFAWTLKSILDEPDRPGVREAATVQAAFRWENLLAPLENEILRLSERRHPRAA